MAVDKTKDIQVGGTLHSIATGNIIAHADEVMDEDYGKKQSVINQELGNRLTEELKGYLPLTGGTVTGNIVVGNLNNLYTTVSQGDVDLRNNLGDNPAGVLLTSDSDITWQDFGITKQGLNIYDGDKMTQYTNTGVYIGNKTSSDLLNAAGGTYDISELEDKVDGSLNSFYLNAFSSASIFTSTTFEDNGTQGTIAQLNPAYKRNKGGFNSSSFYINAPLATSEANGVMSKEDFKKLSNITLGDNGGISGINFNAGPSDSATFAIETKVNDDATTFVFRLTDNIPTQDKIQFRTSQWYDGGVNHYTPVQITDILESRNPTTNELERVANISELPSVVTTATDGLMSAADKTKLDGIDTSNYVNKSGDTISGNLYFSSFVDDRKLRINGDTISVITPTDEDSWATSYFVVKDQEETNLAIGMGAFGQQNIVKYFYLGGEYNYAVMYVDPNGRRVGIGTSTPSEKLEVSGNVKAEGFIIPDGTANEVLTADGSAISINNLVGSATLLGFTESTESNENLEIEATDTINQGFGKLQKAIKDNELVIAEALNSIKDNLGAEDLNAALPDLSTTHYLGSATTFIDCLKALDTKLYEIEQALTLKTV